MSKGIIARPGLPGLIAVLGMAFYAAVLAQDGPKVPIQTDDKGSVYVAPNVSSNQTSIETKGATVGVQQQDGSGVYTGMNTSTPRPTYSVGGSTGGNTSFSGGASTDGKDNKGVKAGITIKY